jgi:hypothetical protein
MPRAYACRNCGRKGHKQADCQASAPTADDLRVDLILLENERRKRSMPPIKNPFQWELLRDARAAVRAELDLALEDLSPRAKAYARIQAAIELLEKIR